MPEASPPPPIQFATVERLIAFLGEPEAIALSNPENPTGTEPNLTTLDEALRYAHGEALPYVSRFDIPTDRVPLLVEQAVCRIARRFLDRIALSFAPDHADAANRADSWLDGNPQVSLRPRQLDVQFGEQHVLALVQ